jgi:hypothetical protein
VADDFVEPLVVAHLVDLDLVALDIAEDIDTAAGDQVVDFAADQR